MALTASKTGPAFEPAPTGAHHLVCVDVNHEGTHENTYKPGTSQEKISIAWQTAQLRDDGSRYLVSQWYTLSLNERANLTELLTSWLDIAWEDIPDDFDLESLIGKNARARLRHKEKKTGGIRAEIQSIEPWEGEEMVPVGYIRKIDRPDYQPPSSEVQPSNFNDNGAAAVNGGAPQAKPAPVQSTPSADTRTPDALLVPLMSEGPNVFGSDFMKHLNKLAKKHKGESVFKLTEAQAGQVLSDLRNTSPAKGLKAKADAIPDTEMDEDPFEDEESDGTTTTQQQSAFQVPKEVVNTAHV